jgi:arsenate reductase-like glutaredoxin family protein
LCTDASGRTTFKTWTVVEGTKIEARTTSVEETAVLKSWKIRQVKSWLSGLSGSKKKQVIARLNAGGDLTLKQATTLLRAQGELSSVYEEVQRELTGKSRDELLERFEKRWNFLWENRAKVKKTYPKFSQAQSMADEELIEAIAQIESDLAINTDREIAIAFLQDQKRFKGRQKGRAHKSFREH